MTFQDKLGELVNRLSIATSDGTIRWTETGDENAFRTVLNKGLVRVERSLAYSPMRRLIPEGPTSVPGENLYEYYLLVFDEKDKEIGRYLPDRPEQAVALRNLWSSASRTALNAEQKLDSLLQEVAGKVGKK
jgi:hypothetical protein